MFSRVAYEAPFRHVRNLLKSNLNVEAAPQGVAGQCADHAAHEVPFRH